MYSTDTLPWFDDRFLSCYQYTVTKFHTDLHYSQIVYALLNTLVIGICVKCYQKCVYLEEVASPFMHWGWLVFVMMKLQRDFYIIFQPTFIFVIVECLQSDKEENIYSGPEMHGMHD